MKYGKKNNIRKHIEYGPIHRAALHVPDIIKYESEGNALVCLVVERLNLFVLAQVPILFQKHSKVISPPVVSFHSHLCIISIVCRSWYRPEYT